MLRAAADPRPEAVGPEGPPLALAVIGHVNHGKTALVRALTGIETDRLKEEIERGLSITLGFAWRDNPTGGVDVIDAPGHEDFLRAMVIGTTGARAVLLVVSATEGFGRQTREHLQIAELLGIRAGVVAITKADLLSGADDEAAAVARIRDSLRGSFLQDEPALLCSAVTGQGLDELHAAIEALATRAPAPRQLAGAFLPIDRAFTIAGTGTVVTGTLQGGPLRSDDAAVLQPSGRAVSLRQIQVHGEGRDGVAPGGRVAIALRGVSADEVRAGEVLCAPGAFGPTLQVDVEVTVAAGDRALRHRDEVRVLWGARQDMARVRLLEETAIAPGERGLAQLRFAAPVVAFAGQPAILRRPSPAETLGGAVVLDPQAPPSRGRTAERAALLRAAADGDVAAIAEALARRDRGLVSLPEVSRLARRDSEDVRERLSAFEALDAARLVLRTETANARQAYLDRLSAAHRQAPTRFRVAVGAIRSGLSAQAHSDLIAHVERSLAADGAIRLDAGQVALPDHEPLASLAATALERFDSLEAALRAGGLTPPDMATLTDGSEADTDLLALLVDSGRALSLRNHALRQTLVFHRDALEAAAAALRAAFPPPLEFTTGEARAALETSRKFIVPVLEYLDTRGLTQRTGDVRRVI